MIKACVCLHNFLILVKDEWEFEDESAKNSSDSEDLEEDVENEYIAEKNFTERLALLNHAFLTSNNML